MPPRSSTEFVRYAQAIVQFVVACLLVWVGAEILLLRDVSIRTEERNLQIVADIAQLRSSLADLRVADANASDRIYAILTRLSIVEARIASLEHAQQRRDDQADRGRGRGNVFRFNGFRDYAINISEEQRR